MAVCSSCGGDIGAGSRFCPACGLALAFAPVVRAARKVVTVVFVDVTGSTSLGEQLDPESLQRVMSRYFAETRLVLERHEGTVAKFIGDAVMAVFGIPVVHEDDALRAVRAAAEIADALARLNEVLEADSGVRLEVRTGVNTGEVLVEDVSSAEGLAVGDAVNVAARLEQVASPGEILLGPDTFRLVHEAVRAEALAPLTVKGKAAPVRAYRLLEVLPRACAPVRKLGSPLVGRERESAALASAFGRAVADRSCQLFTILGPAGIGKSRLVAELVRAASAGGEATVLAGRCLPYGDGITFWPVAEIVDQAAGLLDDEPVGDARAKLLALLEGEDGAEQTADRVAQLLALVPPRLGTDELFRGVRSLLEALARRRPLVVVFDDIHWAEPNMLALIEHVAEWSRDSPLLLVCPARPELLDACPGWGGGQLNASSVLLEPLADAEATTLLQNLLGTAQLPPQVADRITNAAEGNPLFVEEMLAALIDDGHLRAEDDAWVAADDLSNIPVPPSIAALLAARLDRLDAAERAVLMCASVVGQVFWRTAVAELVPADLREDTVAHLTSLVRRDLIRPERSSFAGDDAFHFRHLLIRDAAYAALPKEARAILHEAFAAWLERVTGERVTEYEPIFGYHLEQAYRLRAELGPVGATEVELARRSATWLAAAGRRALVQEDNPASLSLLSRAADLLDPHDAARLALLPDLGDVLLDAGRFAEAETLLAEAVALSSMAGDRGLQAHAAVVALRARFIGLRSLEGWTEDDEDEAQAAIRIFTELDDHCGLARALEVLTHRNW
ncbi:MAG: AAA family ATPase, partial [Actinomycetota bacterium]|nr:AAA family ATPase [Actinomycetota bacterium]